MKTRRIEELYSTPDTLRPELLKRLSERAWHLGIAVAAVSFLLDIAAVIVASYTGWLNQDDPMNWIMLGMLFVCPFIGFVVGFVYYTITAWRDL